MNEPAGAANGQEGGLLAGRYRLLSRLGAGAMGVVWLALDERLRRQVAVKVMRTGAGLDPAGDDQAGERVMREGRIAARLHHPNAIAVHDVAEHDGQPVLVMEYLPSRPLSAVLAEAGPLTPGDAALLGAQAASALAAAHAAGIVHRDIKPANLLVGTDGTIKIADFGISRAADDATLTRAGIVPGTPAYLAPEIARGQEPTAAADIFSLGATLYAAVEGSPPFGDSADNTIALLHRVAAGQISPPRRAGPLYPVLSAMLQADPAFRPVATQVTDALRTIVDGQPVPAGGLRTGAAAPVTPSCGPGGTRLDSRAVTPGPSGHETGVLPWLRSHQRVLLPVAGVVTFVAAVTVLLSQVTSSPQAAPPVTSHAPAPTTAAQLDQAGLAAVVARYYSLLPAHADTAWTQLGPGLRAQGQSTYRSYWATVTNLAITTPPQVIGPDRVSVGLEVRLAGGATVQENHHLQLVPGTGGDPLINADDVVGSQTSTAPPSQPPAKKKKEKQGHGD